MTALSDLTEPETPVTYGVVKPGDEDPEGVRFIRGGDIADGHVLIDQLRTISKEVSNQYKRTLLRGGEIVMSLVGNPGQVAIVPSTLCGANIARQAALIRLQRSVDSRYVYYFLRSPQGQEALGAHSRGSVQQVINLRDLKTVSVPTPPLPEQRAIAHILGTLDDKIELNRRRNQTLEAMARALFKDWFVDFGPVRAKMEGRDPYLPADLWQLFPDRLDDEGKPEGWEIKRIGDVIERLGVGKKYDQKTVKPSGAVPVLDQGKTGIIGFHDDDPGVVASENKPVVVFANHTCYMRLVHFPFSAIQNVLPFIGKGVNTIWAYFATLGKQSFVEYKGHWPDFVIHDVVVSSSELTEKFAILAQPLVQRIWANDSESRTLAQLRDTLLPKLVSGELRIADAEKFIESVGV